MRRLYAYLFVMSFTTNTSAYDIHSRCLLFESSVCWGLNWRFLTLLKVKKRVLFTPLEETEHVSSLHITFCISGSQLQSIIQLI